MTAKEATLMDPMDLMNQQKSTKELGFSISTCAVRNILIGFIVGAMLTGGVAFAAGNGGNFTGCLSSDGTLHKVAKGKQPKAGCTGDETEVGWNEIGKRGKKGPKGTTGDTGPRGSIGPSGDEGIRGSNGPKGADNSEPGVQGLPGPAGEKGPPGDPGRTGEFGDRGPVGLTGERGPRGDAGPKGKTGLPEVGMVVRVFQVVVEHRISRTNTREELTVSCPDGSTAVAGGYELPSFRAILESDVELYGSYQTRTKDGPDPKKWTVEVSGSFDDKVGVAAICARQTFRRHFGDTADS